jgi:predicted DsbA family dithiol-disulfide isomerase
MKIEIWSDIACPWCYVGKRRFERALGSFSHRDDVDVVWRSFQLDPTAPQRHSEKQAELLARKYGIPRQQAEAMNANMTAQAKKEGLDFDFDRVQVGNTFDAHRLIHFAETQGKRAEMVERLFKAYLTDGEALGERDVLVRLADEVGLGANAARAALESNAFAGEVRADEERARSFGISAVPFFAIDEKYGVAGAQPPEALLDVLRQAWNESGKVAVPSAAPADGEGPGCEDGSCAV